MRLCRYNIQLECVTPMWCFRACDSAGCKNEPQTKVIFDTRVHATGAMQINELLELHKTTTEACREVMRKKNHDYTCGSVGVFDNFKATKIIGIHPVLGILIRSIDKFKRIETFVKQGELAVEGEGVYDAIDDVINYMILAKGIIIEEQRTKTKGA